jgi:hypothetical protein
VQRFVAVGLEGGARRDAVHGGQGRAVVGAGPAPLYSRGDSPPVPASRQSRS